MRVIVIGGTGLIGRALVSNLAQDGIETHVLSRRANAPSTSTEAQFHHWDGCTADGWGSLVDGDTAIVNLAGESVAAGRWSAVRKERILQSRVDAAGAVCAAVEQAREEPRVVIHGSAVGFYGPCGDRSIIESHPPGDDYLARVCVEAEGVAARVRSLGVRWVAIRTGVVLSRDGGALVPMLVPFRLGLGGRLGNGRQWFPWIHIHDEVAAIRFVLENDSCEGAFNLTSFDPVRNRHFARVLARALGRPSFCRVPSMLLRVSLGEMATMLLTGQRAVPRRLLEMGFRFRYPEVGAALQDLLHQRKGGLPA